MMPASLRIRLLLSVLALSAAGLLAVGALTWAEQRSFLEGRINEQAKAAVPAISHALDAAGETPDASSAEDSPAQSAGGSAPSTGGSAPSTGGGSSGATRPQPELPPGTYGQRRTASGTVLGEIFITYGQQSSAVPKLPAQMPLKKLINVDSKGRSDVHYRAYAARDQGDGGVTIAAVPLTDVEQTLSRLLLVEGLVIAGVLIALAITAYFLVRLGLRPLDRIEATAGKIAAGDLSRRVSPATPRTEVGRLGIALNAMLDRLERAFSERAASEARLRQFLADASHELRTPLASIRGYAELFRMGAVRDKAAAARAMGRIEDESKRMGVLVQDMLSLARLDEQPRARREQVDLSALAADAVQDALAIDPDRTITLDAATATIVRGDPMQLRQVLANLLSNALSHTPARTTIEVSVRTEQDAATLRVRDHGPGLGAGTKESMFERFWRAEGGRERGRAGAGLGLAIVREIVQAHEGTVSAENAPGGGALFVVRLPSRASAPQARQRV